jgi:hypothetical protein
VYDLAGHNDPEESIQNILSMNPQYILDNEKSLIGAYPNTYTFTKSMAERTLNKRYRELGIKMAIVRPSIIISCMDEPYVGWTDTMAAGGGMCYAVGTGLMHHFVADKSFIFDAVPADFTTNLIIATSYFTAVEEKNNLKILHSATGHLNPITVGNFTSSILKYSNYHPFNKQMFATHARAYKNESEYKLRMEI